MRLAWFWCRKNTPAVWSHLPQSFSVTFYSATVVRRHLYSALVAFYTSRLLWLSMDTNPRQLQRVRIVVNDAHSQSRRVLYIRGNGHALFSSAHSINSWDPLLIMQPSLSYWQWSGAVGRICLLPVPGIDPGLHEMAPKLYYCIHAQSPPINWLTLLQLSRCTADCWA